MAGHHIQQPIMVIKLSSNGHHIHRHRHPIETQDQIANMHTDNPCGCPHMKNANPKPVPTPTPDMLHKWSSKHTHTPTPPGGPMEPTNWVSVMARKGQGGFLSYHPPWSNHCRTSSIGGCAKYFSRCKHQAPINNMYQTTVAQPFNEWLYKALLTLQAPSTDK